MKLILRNVKIFGFDPNFFRTFEDGGKQYSVGLIISDKDKELIDSYIWGKVSKNQDDENIFYGKSKYPIPVFDKDKNKITTPINEVFLADVSILIDEFTPEGKEPIRYSKCLGIHYLKCLEDKKPKMPQKTYNSFDDIFSDEENGNDLFSSVQTFEKETKEENQTEQEPDKEFNDLPWDKDGNEKNDDLPY